MPGRAEQVQTGRHPEDQGPRQVADGTAAAQAAAALHDAREQAAAAQAAAREQAAAPEGASALCAGESLTCGARK